MSLTPVDKNTGIPPENRWKENQQAPPPTHNAGLYTGPAFSGSWGNIPVTPTTANMIHNNLNSANPPPGATTQYPGTDRLGNLKSGDYISFIQYDNIGEHHYLNGQKRGGL